MRHQQLSTFYFKNTLSKKFMFKIAAINHAISKSHQFRSTLYILPNKSICKSPNYMIYINVYPPYLSATSAAVIFRAKFTTRSKKRSKGCAPLKIFFQYRTPFGRQRLDIGQSSFNAHPIRYINFINESPHSGTDDIDALTICQTPYR